MELDSNWIFRWVQSFSFVVFIEPGAKFPCLSPDNRIQAGVERRTPAEDFGADYIFLYCVSATRNRLLNRISKKLALALRGAKRSASEDFFQFAPYGFRGNCGVFNDRKRVKSGFPVLDLFH